MLSLTGFLFELQITLREICELKETNLSLKTEFFILLLESTQCLDKDIPNTIFQHPFFCLVF